MDTLILFYSGGVLREAQSELDLSPVANCLLDPILKYTLRTHLTDLSVECTKTISYSIDIELCVWYFFEIAQTVSFIHLLKAN